MFKVKNKEQRSVSLELFWYCLLRTGRHQRVDSGKKKKKKKKTEKSAHSLVGIVMEKTCKISNTSCTLLELELLKVFIL